MTIEAVVGIPAGIVIGAVMIWYEETGPYGVLPLRKRYRTRCDRGFKRGWKCIVGPHDSDEEPCGLVPRWWNRSQWAYAYRKGLTVRRYVTRRPQ